MKVASGLLLEPTDGRKLLPLKAVKLLGRGEGEEDSEIEQQEAIVLSSAAKARDWRWRTLETLKLRI